MWGRVVCAVAALGAVAVGLAVLAPRRPESPEAGLGSPPAGADGRAVSESGAAAGSVGSPRRAERREGRAVVLRAVRAKAPHDPDPPAPPTGPGGSDTAPGDVPQGARGSARDAARLPPLPVPSDARPIAPTVAGASADVPRVWARLDRPPRGLASEPGSVPGRILLRCSPPADRALQFDVSTDPADALRLAPPSRVTIEAGHDAVVVTVGGVARGYASVEFRPATSDAAPSPGPLATVAVEVRASDEFDDPLLVAVAAPPTAETPGAVAAGDRRVCGIAGTVAGAVRVLRSGFRRFATEPTDVLVGVEDPHGVLGPVPRTVTIPAGRAEPTAPLVVPLRGPPGRAWLRFRAGAATTEIAVDAVEPRWDAPRPVVLPAGAVATVALPLVPEPVAAPAVEAGADRPAVVAVVAVAPRRGASGAAVRLTGVAVGDASVRVSAFGRVETSFPVTVVEREIRPDGGALVLEGSFGSAAGSLDLSVSPPARLTVDADVAGWTADRRAPERVVLRPVDRAVLAAGARLPVRIDGDADSLRVEDGLRATPRTPYEVALRGGAR